MSDDSPSGLEPQIDYFQYIAACAAKTESVSNIEVAGRLPPLISAKIFPEFCDSAEYIKGEFTERLGPKAPEMKMAFNLNSPRDDSLKSLVLNNNFKAG